jgi:hypothetical protein
MILWTQRMVCDLPQRMQPHNLSQTLAQTPEITQLHTCSNNLIRTCVTP